MSRRAVLGGLAGVVLLTVGYFISNPVMPPMPGDRVAQLEATVQKLERQLQIVVKALQESSCVSFQSPERRELALPSPPNVVTPKLVPSDAATLDSTRGFYGGKQDAAHLGGFTQNDTAGQSPALWTFMMKKLVVKSLIDVGCGRGISTKWFLDHGARVLCVEGSSDAVEQSFLPKDLIVQHDFYKGPWWPAETYDAVWAVEFIEHIGRHMMKNYIPIFRRAALIFTTHSYWGGWHHVEVHVEDDWWKQRFTAQGFVYSHELTLRCRNFMAKHRSKEPGSQEGQHLNSLLVYINPAVASLPEHAHVIGGPHCHAGDKRVYCEGEDALPEQFMPAMKTPTPWDDDEWMRT